MKRLLLIMPRFMGYDQALYKDLEQRYEVTFIDSDNNMKKIRDDYYSNKANRLARKIVRPLKLFEQEVILQKYEDPLCNLIDNKAFDVIFAINGHGLTNSTYRKLVVNNKESRRILYLWDDTSNLYKVSHFKFFSERWSYNIDDCKRYNMKYLPMFVRDEYKFAEQKKKYELAIIATAHSDRVEFAQKLYSVYKDSVSFFIYFFDPEGKYSFFSHSKPLDYIDYLRILYSSKAVIDIPNIIQNGPTTRVFDAMYTKTKIISTNQGLRKYPIYSDNICFIDRNNPELDIEFLKSPFVENNCRYYPISDWLRELKI